MTKFLLSAACLAAATGLTPAIARADDGISRIAVHYSDLNLQSPAGRAALQHRLNAAMREACDYRLGLSPMQRLEAERCMRTAAPAVSQQARLVIARTAQPAASQLAAR